MLDALLPLPYRAILRREAAPFDRTVSVAGLLHLDQSLKGATHANSSEITRQYPRVKRPDVRSLHVAECPLAKPD